MWNVMFGRGVGVGGRGFGVDRDEQASVNRDHSKLIYRTFAASLSRRCSNVSAKLPLTKNIWTLAPVIGNVTDLILRESGTPRGAVVAHRRESGRGESVDKGYRRGSS